jgi:hypothetical protein
MQFHRFIFSLLAFALCLPSLRAEDAPPAQSGGSLKILFIGNSFTYSNELPQMLRGLAASQKRQVDVTMHALGGYTLEKHWQEGKAADLICGKKWDFVVLQEQSDGPVQNLKGMKENAGKFDELIEKQGAKTVLFMTWPKQEKASLQRRIALAYEETGKDLGATVAPVGLAWQKITASGKPLTLYSADKFHPSEQGSYLAACVFYLTMVDRKMEGFPGRLVFNGKVLSNISNADAGRLQRAAREAVYDQRKKLAEEKEKEQESATGAAKK